MSQISSAILVVDDNPANLAFLFDALNQAGFVVLTSKNGESALKRAKNVHPDLILLDVMMPDGIGGFETCRRLKADEATQDIPVIFVYKAACSEKQTLGIIHNESGKHFEPRLVGIFLIYSHGINTIRNTL